MKGIDFTHVVVNDQKRLLVDFFLFSEKLLKLKKKSLENCRVQIKEPVPLFH